MSGTPFLRILLIGILALHMAGNAAAGGSIHGTVRYEGELPLAKRRAVTVDVDVCGPEAVSEELALGKRRGVRGAVVYFQGHLEGARSFPRRPEGFSLSLAECRFDPPVLIVATDAEVRISHSDRLNHSLRTVSRTNPPVTLALAKSVPSVSHRFGYPEFIELRCDVHDWERGWIVVAENPYYAVTNEDGVFEIRDVPAGDYTVVLWHELLRFETRRVRVREGETLSLDFSPQLRGTGQTLLSDFGMNQRISRLDINVLPIRLVK